MTSRSATAARRANAARQRRASSSRLRRDIDSCSTNVRGTWERESGMALAAATHSHWAPTFCNLALQLDPELQFSQLQPVATGQLRVGHHEVLYSQLTKTAA